MGLHSPPLPAAFHPTLPQAQHKQDDPTIDPNRQFTIMSVLKVQAFIPLVPLIDPSSFLGLNPATSHLNDYQNMTSKFQDINSVRITLAPKSDAYIFHSAKFLGGGVQSFSGAGCGEAVLCWLHDKVPTGKADMDMSAD